MCEKRIGPNDRFGCAPVTRRRISSGCKAHPATAPAYAYRAGRNARQAVGEVEERLFRGHPDVVDADPRGLLREHSARRLAKVGGASDR